MSVQEIRRLFDHKGNFLLSEEGPNQARQENDWGGWVDKKLKTVSKDKAGPTPRAPKTEQTRAQPAAPKTAAKPKLTNEQVGTKQMLANRIQKWADRFNVSPESVRGDEDLLKAALGSKYKTWVGLYDRD
jgi:hypothetical protein